MLKLFFQCPKCKKAFFIEGYWKWVLKNPFHWFGKRHTKCPYCKQRSWISWLTISKGSKN